MTLGEAGGVELGKPVIGGVGPCLGGAYPGPGWEGGLEGGLDTPGEPCRGE